MALCDAVWSGSQVPTAALDAYGFSVTPTPAYQSTRRHNSQFRADALSPQCLRVIERFGSTKSRHLLRVQISAIRISELV